MIIGSGKHTYEWGGDWAKVPDTESARVGWSHHGIVVTEAGEVISGHQDDPKLMVFDQDGNFKRSLDSGVTETHGMTLATEGDTEYLWIADNGRKRRPSTGYEYPPGTVTGQVVKKSLDGETLVKLETPGMAMYESGDYMPTWVAVNEERSGGNGDVWVADGYGQSYVHRYDKKGNHLAGINGEEGRTGPFDCPHAIFIDTRKSEPELYVADRSNGRVQVYDTDGRYKRAFGADFLTSPSGFVTHGDLMVIAELQARLTVIDVNDNLVSYLGANDEVAEVEGWPNNLNEKGETVPTTLLTPGKFNSPHGMAVDASGNLYLAEWLIGGRFTKLTSL